MAKDERAELGVQRGDWSLVRQGSVHSTSFASFNIAERCGCHERKDSFPARKHAVRFVMMNVGMRWWYNTYKLLALRVLTHKKA